MKKTAFTLAEVLVTLSIVGVVSTLTVPSIMGAFEERELQAQAKKAYNTLQSAITMNYVKTGNTLSATTSKELFSFLESSIKHLKLDGNTIQLADGQVMAGEDVDRNCGTKTCYVLVDINGAEAPTLSSATIATGALGNSLKKLEYSVSAKCGGTSYDRKYRDIIYFEVKGSNVMPHMNHGVTARYFKG